MVYDIVLIILLGILECRKPNPPKPWAQEDAAAAEKWEAEQPQSAPALCVFLRDVIGPLGLGCFGRSPMNR